MSIMDKMTRLRFELAVGDLLENLKIKDKLLLSALQVEMEDCLNTAFLDYCDDNNIDY